MKKNKHRKKRNQMKIITREVKALVAMREIKDLTRAEASHLLELSVNGLESIENGRVELTQERISKFTKEYGFTGKSFRALVERMEVDRSSDSAVKNEIERCGKSNLLSRRSYQKIITDEIRVLKFLRRKRGLTQYEASKRCGYARATIGHIENGRIELDEKRLNYMVCKYGFGPEEFKIMVEGEASVLELISDCVAQIKNMGADKLLILNGLMKKL